MEIKNRLVTADFSELSRSAYSAACALARQYGSALHLVHVSGAWPPFCYLHAEGISTIVPQGAHFEALDKRLEE